MIVVEPFHRWWPSPEQWASIIVLLLSQKMLFPLKMTYFMVEKWNPVLCSQKMRASHGPRVNTTAVLLASKTSEWWLKSDYHGCTLFIAVQIPRLLSRTWVLRFPPCHWCLGVILWWEKNKIIINIILNTIIGYLRPGLDLWHITGHLCSGISVYLF